MIAGLGKSLEWWIMHTTYDKINVVACYILYCIQVYTYCVYVYIYYVCVGNHPKIAELFRLYTTVVSFRRLKKLKAETDAASQYVSHQSEMIGY